MAPSKATRPERLSDLSARLYDVLAAYTVFPGPVLSTQCKRRGRDLESLQAADVDVTLLDELAQAVARFTSREKGLAVRGELEAALRASRLLIKR